MAMELFSKQYMICIFSGDGDSMPMIALKMVQTSLTYGFNSLSGVGFVLYGNYLALVRGEVAEGYRYVKFALLLMKRMPSIAHDGEIKFYATHTKLRVEPMQSAIELYADTYRVFMASGAARSAFGCSYTYDKFSFWSGKKLDIVVASMQETMKQMVFYKSMIMLALLRPLYRLSLRLTGQSDAYDREVLANVFDETCGVGEHPMVVLETCCAKIFEALVFREVDIARDSVQKYILMTSVSKANMSDPGDFFRTL
jgi:predicted ATPase